MYYVLFNSITIATRMKNHFRYSGNKVSLMHTPAEISKGGCSYSLVVNENLYKEVLSVAKEYGISVKGIYEYDGRVFIEVMS